jgi:hypothetical protein
MYLTAHQVRSKAGVEAINAFLYLHKDQTLSYVRPHQPDIDYVSQFAPGYVIAMDCKLRPGGNDVTAFLDFVAEDGVSEEALRKADQKVEEKIGTESLPITITATGLTARFGAVLSWEQRRQSLKDLLDQLWRAALSVLAHRDDPPVAVTGPYAVWASYIGSDLQLRLPPPTLLRLPRTPGRRAKILVPQGLVQAVHTPDMLRELCLSLLGLDREAIKKEGGIEVVDPRTGTLLAHLE